MSRAVGVFLYLFGPPPLTLYNNGEQKMKREELIKRTRKGIQRSHNDATKMGITDLLVRMDELLMGLKPIIEHGKEATDEYNDYPTDSNRVVMEMARQNVLHCAFGVAELLSNDYEKLTRRTKDSFTFGQFCDILCERLTTILNN